MFVSLLTTRLILNNLGAVDYGIFNIVGGAITLLGFLNGAMANSTQRFMSYSEGEGVAKKKTDIFNCSLVLHTCLAVIIGLILLIATVFLFNGILNIPPERIQASFIVYISLVVSTMFTMMTVPYDAVLKAHENMKYYALVGIFESVLKLIVALLVIASNSDKLIVYGILMAAIPLVTLSIMRFYCHHHYDECVYAPRKYWNKRTAKNLTKFAGLELFGYSAYIVGYQSCFILLNHFFGVIVNAAAGIVSQIEGQMLVLTSNLQGALNPVIVKKEGAHDREGMLRWSCSGCKFSYLLFVWIAIPLWFEAEYVMKLWLKNVPEWTVLFIRLTLIRRLLILITTSFEMSLSATACIKEKNIQNAILYCVLLLTQYILYKNGFSPTWMYITMIIMAGGQSAYLVFLCHKHCSLDYGYYIKSVFMPMLFVTSALIIVNGYICNIMTEGFSRLTVNIVGGVTVYLLITYFFALNKDEKQGMTSITNRFKSAKPKNQQNEK